MTNDDAQKVYEAMRHAIELLALHRPPRDSPEGILLMELAMACAKYELLTGKLK